MNIQQEQPIPFSEAANRLPKRRRGKKTHVATIHRWATIGCRGVKLEFLCIGAQRCTSIEAMQRFFDRLTELDTAAATSDSSPKPTPARKKAVDAARRRMARAK